jgi:hypothetical protein
MAVLSEVLELLGYIWAGGRDETTCERVINREINYMFRRGCAQRQFDRHIRGGNSIKSLP